MSELFSIIFNAIRNPTCEFLQMEHLLVMLAVYGVPSIVALTRNSRNLIPIVWCNILLGWTIIVWFVVLIWASNTGTYENESENEDSESSKKLSRKFKRQK